jgi:uncharacterized cupin superfamily protein
VDYKDGSLTRLDANAEFTLTDLSTAAQTQRVAGTLDSGRAWSNVQKVTSSDGRYEIDTSVATASVRGTKFNVDCAAADGSCTYTVVEGTVTVTPKGGGPVDLGRGQSITVRPDGSTTTVETKSPTQLLDDPWIAKNVRIDAAEARPSSASSTDGGSAASATVQYTGVNRAEAVRFVCRPGSGCAFLPPVTPVTEVPANGGTYHFTRQIDLGEICITSAGPKGHEIIVETWDLTPSTTTTQLKGVDVPAHMNGTHVTETIEVPNCLAADRREASIDSGPEPG